MDVNTQDIERIVRAVLSSINSASPAGATIAGQAAQQVAPGVFNELDDAVAAAMQAQKSLKTIAMRNLVIAAIRQAGEQYARELAELAVAETGMGRVDDKIAKNISQARHTPGTECLAPQALTGDHGLTLIENAPWGVIASVTPSTNPAATVINNAISMVSGGNAVLFAPHPKAKEISKRCIQALNRAIHRAVGIMNLLTAVRAPSIETATRMFSHPGVNLLVGEVRAGAGGSPGPACGGDWADSSAGTPGARPRTPIR